jgi:hypothetical protein
MGHSMPMIHGPKKYSAYREATSSCAWTTEYDQKHQQAELRQFFLRTEDGGEHKTPFTVES